MLTKRKLKGRCKQPTKRTLKENAWRVFSQFIRLRDCLSTTGTFTRGKCFSCGSEVPFNRLQAGHFIAGRHNGNLFSEEGCNAQCRACNIFKHGNQLEYRKAIVKKYGKDFDLTLEKEAQEVKQFTIQDLIGLAEYYKREISQMEGMR